MPGLINGAMCHLMVSKLAILFSVMSMGVGTCAFGASMGPGDEQVEAYLKAHAMTGLLEIQLEERIRDAKNKDEQQRLIEKLSKLYLDQLSLYGRDDPYRQIVINRARSLTERMGSSPMYALRIELLIESYLGVESAVELARLELLDDEDRQQAIDALVEINRGLNALVGKIDPAVAQQERLRIRAKGDGIEQATERLAELRRYRSLGHYYHGWTGYSLAVLKEQHVPAGVFASFGWLLGSEGDMPQLSLLNKSTLEYEHVARAAIGVAMSYAQSDDSPAGRAWARAVVESEYTDSDARLAGEDRQIQIMAIDRDWIDTYEYVHVIERQRGERNSMRVGDARFLALQALHAMDSTRAGRGGLAGAKKVGQYALEQLVELKEIGHVLDLYRRFDSLPMLADGFIPHYARALAELRRIEQTGKSGMYASVASLIAQALDAPDADRFPEERDDASLKLAYAEIRSGRATQAIQICDAIIETSTNEASIEEARWMRIAAIDSVDINANTGTSKRLKDAVREYIVAYPSTARSAQLILRHALQGAVDARVAIESLSAIGDDDPIVLPARRALVQLEYQQLKATGFRDAERAARVLAMVRWILEKQPKEVVDLSDAKSRIGTIRIGLDLSLRIPQADIELANRLVELGMGILAFDSSLSVYRSEFVYRQVEVALRSRRVDDAMDLLDELGSLDQSKARSARILVFNGVLERWNQRPDVLSARRIVDLGSVILSEHMPAYPEPMGVQMSGVAETIAHAGVYLWDAQNDTDDRDLALRVSLMVLERGNPTEQGLRRTAALAAQVKDYANELEAWLRLLGAYPNTDEKWYQARYESLRVMKRVNFARALSAYDQYRVLHPTLGPEPWNERIAGLFGDTVPKEATP